MVILTNSHGFFFTTGQWIPCGTAKDCKANVTGLSEGKPYKFRVKAVNKEGESEELETEKPIIAKNPFGEFIIPVYFNSVLV